MMRDFCNFSERDCIRLIVAQDLKEDGIDLDAAQKPQIPQQNNKQTIVNKSNMSLSHDQETYTNRVFGAPLKNAEMVEVKLNEQTLNIPIFLKHTVDHISQYLNVEGIFRRNGTATRLRELKKLVEEGQYNFTQYTIFDITSLVKLFFRELPESLLTCQLYSYFIQAIKLIDTTKSKTTILNLCLQLPDINLHVLIYLMHFLKQISIHENENKMNSYNLAVCFAPNIIYTRINKINELYINEERMIIQFLIENSSLIGKVSDSVYERSLMLTSLCCSDTKDFDGEQESFATARSTSLSSYCNNKKEKKKRRSSSLKELMTTIQNSISKFRRRSASEKNDKTTCSIISHDTSTRILGDETPIIQQKSFKLLTPMNTNLYTPCIKRNVEEAIQTTTKKKLLEKFPQRNLLPNAPTTPFSTIKKNRHQLKVPITENKDSKFQSINNTQPSISIISSSMSCASDMHMSTSHTPKKSYLNTQAITATPLNVINLQKQLKYDDSPSVLFAAASASKNPIYDSSKMKSQHLNSERNHTISNGESAISECRRRLEMPSDYVKTKLNYNPNFYNQMNLHHHHRHHKNTSSSSYSSHHHQHSTKINTNNLLNQNDTICSSNIQNDKNNNTSTNRKRSPSPMSPSTTHSQSTSEYSTTQQRLLTDSMRCSLKRGRPNTPKTGLNTEYRSRKSSVHTTPEVILNAKEIYEKKQKSSNLLGQLNNNLDTAIIQLDDEDENKNYDQDLVNNPLYSNMEDLNDARLDDAIVGDDLDDDEDEDEADGDDDVDEEDNEVGNDKSECDNDRVLVLLNGNKIDLEVENIENESQLEIEAMKSNDDKENMKNSVIPKEPKRDYLSVYNPFGDENFEADEKSMVEITKMKLAEIDTLDSSINSVLRRQSLFKLKEKMNGRVGKQISEIEKRKLSPYRFSNSPLNHNNNQSKISPLCSNKTNFTKNLLTTPIIEEQFVIKTRPGSTKKTPLNPQLPIESPFVVKCATEFIQMKKFQRNKSVKRLVGSVHSKKSQSPLSKSLHGSPVSKNLMHSTVLNYASETFDF